MRLKARRIKHANILPKVFANQVQNVGLFMCITETSPNTKVFHIPYNFQCSRYSSSLSFSLPLINSSVNSRFILDNNSMFSIRKVGFNTFTVSQFITNMLNCQKTGEPIKLNWGPIEVIRNQMELAAVIMIREPPSQ